MNRNIIKNVYNILLNRVLETAPRVLAHLDRNECSVSYGFFGRGYWAWKTRGFRDAANCYAIYFLALLWRLDDEQNPYFRNAQLLKWIIAGLQQWCSLQKKDGSFEQVFINEHSFGAASYTLLAVLETLRLTGECIPQAILDKLDWHIEKTSEFLLKNDETYGVISNHSALFALAFHRLLQKYGDERFRQRCQQQLKRILENSSEEGWFLEYDGADPGYTTQCLHYLVILMEEGYDELTQQVITCVEKFIPYFMHPNGSFGGHYGSRNTAIFYPGAFARLADENCVAAKILMVFAGAAQKGTTPVPPWLDIENSFRLGANYLESCRSLQKLEQSGGNAKAGGYILPFEQPEAEKFFRQAGLLIKGNRHYYTVISLRKGGAIVVFDKLSGRRVSYDFGYTVDVGGHSYTTQIMSVSNNFEFEKNSLSLRQPFYRLSLSYMTPLKYFILLAAGFSIFRFAIIADCIKKLLVKILVIGKSPGKGQLERQITYEPNQIIIEDQIHLPSMKRVKNLRGGHFYSAIHMASADFFDFTDLMDSPSIECRTVKEGITKVITSIRFPFTGVVRKII